MCVTTNPITITNLNDLCKCSHGDITKRCEIDVYYTTQNGLEKKISQTILLECTTKTIPLPKILVENCFDDSDNPIQICTLSDLNQIRNYLDRDFQLQENIDASETTNWNSGEGWIPIGEIDNAFTGTLDGKNKSISNIYINRSQDNQGLFGVIENAEIYDLTLEEINLSGRFYVGGVTGKQEGAE